MVSVDVALEPAGDTRERVCSSMKGAETVGRRAGVVSVDVALEPAWYTRSVAVWWGSDQ